MSSIIGRVELKRASVAVFAYVERQAMECGSAKVPGGSQAELQHEGAGVGDAPEGRSRRVGGDCEGEGGVGVWSEGLLGGQFSAPSFAVSCAASSGGYDCSTIPLGSS